ncbi:hypothetical protein [Pseudoalteromonas sp. G4]|uniref:hypothetical protein n=1 Tax=Pseudoalteromonas sp. G4 TaxID=2992761 RepID=UPI00237E6F8B|nr:hypothetical protein [Pseudoalteromonas sp. G4]MDE3273735.1 hypothetical protein [Pseudoalteromonas sp. G4]
MVTDSFISFIKSYYFGLPLPLIFAAIILFLLKDKKGLMFSLVTLAFFGFGALTHEFIKDLDQGIYIWRYLLWAANDFIWIVVISRLANHNKTHLLQSCLGILVVFPAPLIQLFRAIDRHYFDLSLSDYVYVIGLPFINTLTIIICYIPVVAILFSRCKNYLAPKPQM